VAAAAAAGDTSFQSAQPQEIHFLGLDNQWYLSLEQTVEV
jgi:hypothetical protein